MQFGPLLLLFYFLIGHDLLRENGRGVHAVGEHNQQIVKKSAKSKGFWRCLPGNLCAKVMPPAISGLEEEHEHAGKMENAGEKPPAEQSKKAQKTKRWQNVQKKLLPESKKQVDKNKGKLTAEKLEKMSFGQIAERVLESNLERITLANYLRDVPPHPSERMGVGEKPKPKRWGIRGCLVAPFSACLGGAKGVEKLMATERATVTPKVKIGGQGWAEEVVNGESPPTADELQKWEREGDQNNSQLPSSKTEETPSKSLGQIHSKPAKKQKAQLHLDETNGIGNPTEKVRRKYGKGHASLVRNKSLPYPAGRVDFGKERRSNSDSWIRTDPVKRDNPNKMLDVWKKEMVKKQLQSLSVTNEKHHPNEKESTKNEGHGLNKGQTLFLVRHRSLPSPADNSSKNGIGKRGRNLSGSLITMDKAAIKRGNKNKVADDGEEKMARKKLKQSKDEMELEEEEGRMMEQGEKEKEMEASDIVRKEKEESAKTAEVIQEGKENDQQEEDEAEKTERQEERKELGEGDEKKEESMKEDDVKEEDEKEELRKMGLEGEEKVMGEGREEGTDEDENRGEEKMEEVEKSRMRGQEAEEARMIAETDDDNNDNTGSVMMEFSGQSKLQGEEDAVELKSAAAEDVERQSQGSPSAAAAEEANIHPAANVYVNVEGQSMNSSDKHVDGDLEESGGNVARRSSMPKNIVADLRSNPSGIAGQMADDEAKEDGVAKVNDAGENGSTSSSVPCASNEEGNVQVEETKVQKMARLIDSRDEKKVPMPPPNGGPRESNDAGSPKCAITRGRFHVMRDRNGSQSPQKKEEKDGEKA